MKKSFLLILASLFAIFALSGCADDSNNDTPAVTGVTNTPVDLANPGTLNGNYKVVFFGSQVTNPRNFTMPGLESYANLVYVSNDCAKAEELYPTIVNQTPGVNQCTTEQQVTILDGSVVMTVVNGNLNISSRMQMEGGSIELSPSDKYQYTIYNETTDLTNFQGTGVTGWNYDAANNTPSATSTSYPESPFTISKLDNGSIRIDMTLVGKTVDMSSMMPGISGTVDAVNTIILEKVNDDTTALENKIQVEFGQSNPGTDNPEDTTPTVTPADITKPETLNGKYEVTFFGTQVTNVQSSSPFAGMADMFYISNDCVKAQELYPDIVNQGGKNQCKTPVTMLDGSVVMTVENGNLNITSRMQMDGSALEMSPSDKYQYTNYNQTNDLTNYQGMGVTGWNYDAANNAPSATSTSYPESPFKITQLDDGSLRIDMTLVNKYVTTIAGTVDAVNTIILKKVSDDTTALENALQADFSSTGTGL